MPSTIGAQTPSPAPIAAPTPAPPAGPPTGLPSLPPRQAPAPPPPPTIAPTTLPTVPPALPPTSVPAAPAPAAPAQPAPNVVAISIEGNTHVPTAAILAVLHTKVGQPFDPQVVQDDLRAIADMGYFADQAPPVIQQRPNGVALTYRVVENPVVTAINFVGNKTVTSDTLSALMDTSVGQVFNLRTYQEDILKINSYYDKIGFGGQVPSHVVDVNIDTSGVLTLTIEEGLTVRNIVIVQPPDADPVLPARVIIPALVTKAGQTYSDTLRDKDVNALKDLYRKYDLTIGDFEAGIDPSTIDTKTGTADVRYAISVARVAAIEITGNTKTHDDVIRRELRLLPGMVITDAAVRNDYNRLNNLGFFEKVDVTTDPGPDPRKPADVTLKWTVKEQRTGTAQIGAGYSGGITGTGLTGNISYSENNVNGTGNSATIRLEKGAQIGSASLSFSMPYLGDSPQWQKYSLGATIFTQSQTNYYPVYLATPAPAPGITATPIPAGAPVPVAIVPANPSAYNLINGIASTYESAASGISATIGRRLSDFVRASLGANIQEVQANATVPAPYFFPSSSAFNPLALPTTNPFNGTSSPSNAIGIIAPSLAEVNSAQPYALRSLVLGIGADTRDDVQNPRNGWNAAVSEEVSCYCFGSAFSYTQTILDVARFFPAPRNSTIALHARSGTSTGAIPTNKLYTFSDQQLRGYTNPYYGTDELLFQAEWRVPVTKDRKFSVVLFGDDGAVRIAGGQQINSDNSLTDLNSFQWHVDAGVGIRFDIPQLGLRTIRLDFAKGSLGTHLSFGIGQAF